MAEPKGNDGNGTAIPGGGKNDPNGRDLTEIPKPPIAQLDNQIATVKSLQGIKTETKPAEYLLYEEAIGRAVRLYHSGKLDKEDFRLAVSSLKEDAWGCASFCAMSDELCIDWIMEKAEEGGRCTRNTKA